MDIFILSKSRHICYNSSVPQKRDESIFDRGGRQVAPAVGPKPGSCIPRDRIGRAACPHAAASTAEGQNLGRLALVATDWVGRVAPRPPTSPKELRRRIRRPQCIRNSVLGFVVKPLTFHNEKSNTMVRRMFNHAAYSRFLFFVRVLSGTCHEMGFRGCAAFFLCRSGVIR